MDGFLLPGAKSHYVPDLMIFPVHQGTAIEEREKEHFLFRISVYMFILIFFGSEHIQT